MPVKFMLIGDRALSRLVRFFPNLLARLIFKFLPIEKRFSKIYHKNDWGSGESRSGPGSTLVYTENLRNHLPSLVNTYNIKTIFDAPCGDFNWMRHVLQTIEVDYIGGDIVSSLIEENRKKYKQERVKFIIIDLVGESIPYADMMICRDLLFHLSFKDGLRVLKNFVDSGTPLLLTSNHINNANFKNVDIATGGFRLIDLFSCPYNFPSLPLLRVMDYIPPYPPREMCLFSRDQVIFAIDRWDKQVEPALKE